MRKQEFLQVILLFCLIIFGIFRLFSLNAARINIISIAYTKNPAKGLALSRQNKVYHPRADIWELNYFLLNGELDKAKEIFNRHQYRGDPLWVSQAGKLLVAEGNIVQAMDKWKSINDLESMLNLMRQSLNSGDISTSEVAFLAAWQLSPENLTRAYAEFLRWPVKDYKQMEKILTESLDRYPLSKNRSIWTTLLADAFHLEGKDVQSIDLLQTELRKTPDDWRLHLQLGRIFYESHNDVYKSIQEIKTAIRLAPDEGEPPYLLARILYHETRYEEAEDWFKIAIKNNPANPNWRLLRALNARADGNYRLAYSVYSQTIDEFPQFGPAYIEFAWTYYQDKNIPNALSILKNLPDDAYNMNANLFNRMGQIYEAAEDMNAAIQAYTNALKYNEDNTYAKSRLDLIAP